MFEIWTSLTPILLADVLNPVLFAFMVYAAGSKRPVLSSSAMLFGHTFAYFSAGIVLALGLEMIAERLANPRSIDFVISLIVGILLVWMAFKSSAQKEKKQPEQSGELGPVKAFFFGAVINFIGIPFALPYFAALDQILKADFSTFQVLQVLVSYNLLYALPFTVVPLVLVFLGERGRPLLQKINDWLDKGSGFLMPIILGLVGVALIADAIYYFTTGSGLI